MKWKTPGPSPLTVSDSSNLFLGHRESVYGKMVTVLARTEPKKTFSSKPHFWVFRTGCILAVNLIYYQKHVVDGSHGVESGVNV